MKEELTTKMHSEFVVSNTTDLQFRCFSFWEAWSTVKFNEEVRDSLLTSYNISWADALKEKDNYLRLKT